MNRTFSTEGLKCLSEGADGGNHGLRIQDLLRISVNTFIYRTHAPSSLIYISLPTLLGIPISLRYLSSSFLTQYLSHISLKGRTDGWKHFTWNILGHDMA